MGMAPIRLRFSPPDSLQSFLPSHISEAISFQSLHVIEIFFLIFFLTLFEHEKWAREQFNLCMSVIKGIQIDDTFPMQLKMDCIIFEAAKK